MEVLRWVWAAGLKDLRSLDGCPWDRDICVEAAGGGHLEVLRWARTNGCPWDKYTCAYAAEEGRLAHGAMLA